jgi:hypothetical protein
MLLIITDVDAAAKELGELVLRGVLRGVLSRSSA